MTVASLFTLIFTPQLLPCLPNGNDTRPFLIVKLVFSTQPLPLAIYLPVFWEGEVVFRDKEVEDLLSRLLTPLTSPHVQMMIQILIWKSLQYTILPIFHQLLCLYASISLLPPDSGLVMYHLLLLE